MPINYFQNAEMHEDKNSHTAFHLVSTELRVLDFVVQTCGGVRRHQRKSTLVYCAAYFSTIFDYL